MTNERYIDSYVIWLCGLIENDHQNLSTHSMLLATLFAKLFCPFIEEDTARSHDGLDLRHEFCVTSGVGVVAEPVLTRDLGPCNVLEMLIGLCLRCERDISGDPREELNPGKWFWLMMENIGLDIYRDDMFYPDAVDEILDQFLTRQYLHDGRGGLFHFKNPHLDSREMPIWAQLCTYINENPNLIG